jgi:hypothetical protein
MKSRRNRVLYFRYRIGLPFDNCNYRENQTSAFDTVYNYDANRNPLSILDERDRRRLFTTIWTARGVHGQRSRNRSARRPRDEVQIRRRRHLQVVTRDNARTTYFTETV